MQGPVRRAMRLLPCRVRTHSRRQQARGMYSPKCRLTSFSLISLPNTHVHCHRRACSRYIRQSVCSSCECESNFSTRCWLLGVATGCTAHPSTEPPAMFSAASGVCSTDISACCRGGHGESEVLPPAPPPLCLKEGLKVFVHFLGQLWQVCLSL